MFSGCKKDDSDDEKNDDKGGVNVGLPFGEYSLPENIHIEWKLGVTVRVTKIGNDYLSTGGNVASSDYCLKYNAEAKTWQEYIKVYRMDWSPLETYTAAELKTKLKEDRYLGFILKALDGEGFSKTGLGGVSIGTRDADDKWQTVTRSAVIYSDGTTSIYKDIEYGIALETKMGEVSLQSISFIGTKTSFDVNLP
jgi:hypothetical protein